MGGGAQGSGGAPLTHTRTHAPQPHPCRSLLDIPETRADWWQLYERHLSAPLAEGRLRLVLVNSDSVGGGGGGGGGGAQRHA